VIPDVEHSAQCNAAQAACNSKLPSRPETGSRFTPVTNRAPGPARLPAQHLALPETTVSDASRPAAALDGQQQSRPN
jgi:hypothetical protein